MESKRIAYVASEVVPFAKTGGLADVAGALPSALSRLGHDVKVFMPLYSSIDIDTLNIVPFKTDIKLTIGTSSFQYDLYHIDQSDSSAKIYFIKYDEWFGRDSLYIDPETGKDWADNDSRFIFFSRAVIQSLSELDWIPDMIHCNDWQSGLIPAFLKLDPKLKDHFAKVSTAITIHNIAYQGLFPAESFSKTGLAENHFFPTSGFEFYEKLSFLKAGLSYADIINTVSEKYAEEIQQSEEFGYGLEGVLRNRGEDLFGILNGIDHTIWNPASDGLIKAKYSAEKPANKQKNKNALKKMVKLPMVRRDIPLIGMISRLCDQKGFDLVTEIADQIFELDIQMVILGTGDDKYEELLSKLALKYPKKLSVQLKFDNSLAHLIEAGSDMFLMPSLYEPCGLNQIYSLRYGTVPIVRETGGLADTVTNCNPARGTGNGFLFKRYNALEMLNSIRFAAEVYKNKPAWSELVQRGMADDFSWDKSAVRYSELYEKATAKKKAAIT